MNQNANHGSRGDRFREALSEWHPALWIKILILSCGCLLLGLLFHWIVADSWNISYVNTAPLAVTGTLPVGEDDSCVIEQGFTLETDEIIRLQLSPGRIRPDVSGEVSVQLLADDGAVLTETVLEAKELIFDALNTVSLDPILKGKKGDSVLLRIDASGTGVSFQYGKTASAGKFEVQATEIDRLAVGGAPFEGRLVLGLVGRDILGLAWLSWALVGLLWLFLLGWIIVRERNKTHPGQNFVRTFTEVAQRYSFLLSKLVERDFRVKYQNSMLGVLWSFLNPLLTMFVYLFVFSTIFRSDIAYFPVYLMTGIVLFNFFHESTTQGLITVTVNRALIMKVYMPKMLFPLSKVLSSTVNLTISFIPLLIVMILTGVPFHKSLLLLPLVILFLAVFSTGMTFILSTMNVFFRDIQFLWGILVTILNFLTPIFYPESIIPQAFRVIYHMNPLYQIIYFLRCITIGGISPTPITYLYCFLSAFIPLAIGILVFRRQQDRFVLYL